MLTAIVGVTLGASGLHLRWKGLATLAVAAIVLPIISTSIALQLNPSVQQVDLRPASLAQVTGVQFLGLVFWFVVGSAVPWLVKRQKRQDATKREQAASSQTDD